MAFSKRVQDIIADSTWSPPRSRSASVSVLMPIFRRNADGLLSKAIDSILGQSFEDIELIIIDDASTDGSAQTIAEFQRRDPRVGCITHPLNVGLPAISEYEAYRKSRGSYLVFAFDDVVFETDAIQKLHEVANGNPGRVIHGEMDLALPGGGSIRLCKGKHSYSLLSQTNFIANSSVMVERDVIEDVGLYDPHIIASRTCDWDLWRRMMKKYPFLDIPVLIGTEYGGARDDSLGSTYPLHSEVMQEYFSIDRDRLLRPSAFENINVWDTPDKCSAGLAISIDRVRRHFATRFWADDQRIPPVQAIAPTRRVVSVVGYADASTMTIFEGLSEIQNGPAIRFVELDSITHNHLIDFISSSDAVIIVRNIHHSISLKTIDICKNLEIPHFYCVDDNLIVLSQEYENDLSLYTVERLRGELVSFSGVLVASPNLKDYFNSEGLHDKIHLIKPSFSEKRFEKCRSIRPQSGEALTVGFLGGDFRAEALEKAVFPALVRLSERRDIRLYCREDMGRNLHNAPFLVKNVPFSDGYEEFLTSWAGLGIDVIVHPQAVTKNAPFKADSIIMNAYYLGAVPVLSKDDQAFSSISEGRGIVLSGSSPEEWYDAILRAADMQAADLDDFVHEAFSPCAALQNIVGLLSNDLITVTDLVIRQEKMRGVLSLITPNNAHLNSYSDDLRHSINSFDVEIENLLKQKKKLAEINNQNLVNSRGGVASVVSLLS